MEEDKVEGILREYYRKRIEHASTDGLRRTAILPAGTAKRPQKESPWLSLLLTAAALSFILVASSMRPSPGVPGTGAGASIFSGSGPSPADLLSAWEKARFAFPNAEHKGDPL